MRFPLVIGSVCAADCLKQSMILHGLVKIHNLKNRCIKTSQQLSSDNNQLKGAVWITKVIQHFCFLITVTTIFLIPIFLIVVRVHDDGSCFLTKQFIKDFLVFQAALAIIDYNLSLISVWLDLLFVMLCNMLTDFSDTRGVVHNGLHIDTARKFILFLFGQTGLFSHCIKLEIQLVFVNMKLNRDRLEMKRKRCSITNRVGERVAAHVS